MVTNILGEGGFGTIYIEENVRVRFKSLPVADKVLNKDACAFLPDFFFFFFTLFVYLICGFFFFFLCVWCGWR